MDSGMVAKAFVQQYYCTFGSNRADLGWFYNDESLVNFEGRMTQGAQSIVNMLISPPIQQCQHRISTLAGEQHALKFSQMFHLMPARGRLYIVNDIFRLNYA